jgi:hypothetical protein
VEKKHSFFPGNFRRKLLNMIEFSGANSGHANKHFCMYIKETGRLNIQSVEHILKAKLGIGNGRGKNEGSKGKKFK